MSRRPSPSTWAVDGRCSARAVASISTLPEECTTMMPFSSLSSRHCRSSKDKRTSRIGRQYRLTVEHLEDRHLLATGLRLVTGLTDSPSALLTTGFYYDLMGRAPAAGEVAGWVSALQSGVSPYQEAL